MLRSTAKRIVKEIINDLSDRAGIGSEWDSIDSDIQEEIKERLTEIVLEGAESEE